MGSALSRILGYSPLQVGVVTTMHDRYMKIIHEIQEAGLESSNILVGIDFTKSNCWKGKSCSDGRCLHRIENGPNPYEQAISMINSTLSKFDEDNCIPCFGFGDVTTHDKDVFSFYPDNRPCQGFCEALERYKELLPSVTFSGPTSFAPIIETAIDVVSHNGSLFHILIIIADGQVAGLNDKEMVHSSPQADDTVNAIVKASQYPLSIILVGVGDGPWDMMKGFGDRLPPRDFDNFQFINFTEIMSRDIPEAEKADEFAVAALGKIPKQFQASNVPRSPLDSPPRKRPLPPPDNAVSSGENPSHRRRRLDYTNSANSRS